MITPSLVFSESALAEIVEQWNSNADETSRCWAAGLTRVVPVDLLTHVILPVTKIASCSTVADAAYLAEAGFRQIILTCRVVDADSLRRLRCVAERTQIVAVIDHFRHAELLSQSLSQTSAKIQILIEVDVGREVAGVQPGPDVALLAAAASRLPGLKVVGVFASAMEFPADLESAGRSVPDRQPANAVSQVPICDFATVIRIVNHAARNLQGVISDAPETIVAVSSPSQISSADGRISCLIASPFYRSEGSTHDIAQQAVISVVATVISRPSLERCVINTGRIALGDTSGLRVESPSGTSILHVMAETSTLLISGEARDLRIGDIVRLSVANPECLLNLSRIGPVESMIAISHSVGEILNPYQNAERFGKVAR